MKKLFFFLAAIAVAFTANAKVIQGTPNPGEKGRVGWWVNGDGQTEAGDTIILADGEYEESSSIYLNKAGLVIMAAEGAKPVIKLTGEWTALNVSASTTFDGITFDGTNVAYYIIATHDSISLTTDLTIKNCEFKNWNQWAISNQYEDKVSVNSVVIDNCLFHDAKNSAVYFSDKAPEGKNACQDLKITNSTFYNIGDASAYTTVYCVGGNAVDAQKVTVDYCTFYNCQAKNTDHAAVRVTCAATISNTIIVAPASQGTYRAIHATDGSNAQAINCLTYNYEKDSGGIRSGATKTDCQLNVDPKFIDAANGNFALAEGSPALGAGTDGSNLGDPRWNVVAEPEISWIEMPLEITNLTTDILTVGEATYLQLMGRNDMEDSDVRLFLNNYTGEEKAYEVNVENSNMTFGGSELTIIDGSITKSVDPELGDVYAGTVHASIGEEDETMYVEFALQMYALPAIEIEIEDVTITVDWDNAIATFATTWEDAPLSVEVSGFEEVEFKEYPECWLTIGDDVNWVDAAAGPVAVIIEDGVAMLEGEFTSYDTGKSYNVTLTGTLPAKPQDPTALDNLNTTVAPAKAIVNGQLVILKDGVKYNAQGAQL